ncbi:MAG: hypothetical protein DDT26_00111 [Dehalococcoidia bacterium]|nr:hypothetical protein [Chloroflexota bacterium]
MAIVSPLLGLAVSFAGNLLLNLLFPKNQSVEGPRQGDLSVSGSSYGQGIPFGWGEFRVTGNLIWADELEEVATTRSQGGKGGGGSSVTTTNFTYYGRFAYLFCKGPIAELRKLWLNGEVFFDPVFPNVNPGVTRQTYLRAGNYFFPALSMVGDSAELYLLDGSFWGVTGRMASAYVREFDSSLNQFVDHVIFLNEQGQTLDMRAFSRVDLIRSFTSNNTTNTDRIRFYGGSDTQLPDPIIQAKHNQATPAYRGRCYCVFDRIDLSDYGNRPPNVAALLKTQTFSLGAIIRQVCQEAGIPDAFIDTGAIGNIFPKGILIESPTSARNILENLMVAYDVEAIEANGVLVFRQRTTTLSAAFLGGFLAVYELGQAVPSAYTETDQQETELPYEVRIKYLDDQQDYATNSQQARREASASDIARSSIESNLPIVLSPNEALDIARRVMRLSLTRRKTYEFTLGPQFAVLTPGDVIQVDLRGTGGGVIVQITKVDIGANYVVRVFATLVSNDFRPIPAEITYQPLNLFTDDIAANSPTPPPPPVITPPPPPPLPPGYIAPPSEALQRLPTSPTITAPPTPRPPPPPQFNEPLLRLIDSPLFRDEGAEIGLYLVGGGSFTRGAVARYRNTTAQEVLEVIQLSQQGVIGAATTVLGACFNAALPDFANVVTVQIASGELNSVQTTDWLNYVNLAIIGGEIVAFQTATLLSTRTYQLSGFLRGLYNTEPFITGHTATDGFVLLNSAVGRITAPLGVQQTYRIYQSTFSAELHNNLAVATNTGQSLRPYSPVQLKGRRLENGDLVLTWRRRSRQVNEALLSPDTPLNETSEQYEIQINNRTVIVNSAIFTYTSAMRIADGLGPAAAVSVRLWQLNDHIGKGNVLETTI